MTWQHVSGGKTVDIRVSKVFGALGLLVLGLAPAQAAVSFGNAAVQAQSYNIIGDSSYDIDRQDTDVVDSATPSTLNAAAASNSNTLLNTGFPARPYLESASAVSSGAAFGGADQLTFDFAGSFAQSLAPSSPLLSFANSSNSAQLTYDFTVSALKTLSLVQELTAGSGPQSDFFFSSDLTIRQLFDDGSTTDIFSRGGNSNILLTFSTPLGPGSYRAFLSHNLISSVAATNGLTTAGSLASRINVAFTEPVITAIPEPATWLTLIIGFGLVGGVLRRKALVSG